VDPAAGAVDGGGRDRLQRPAAALRGARARGARRGELRLPAVYAGNLQSVPPARPAGARRTRSQSDPAGPGTGSAPADSLHRLCRLRRRVCVRLRRDARRTTGPGLGALDAPLDDRRVVIPHLRHRARQLLGVLRARLGRLLVLGSGRERLVHAVAGGHRPGALAGGHGQARPVQELDPAAGDSGIFTQHAGHLPGALGRSGVGALVRGRSEPRHFHSRRC
jgi:hypothetical protein